MLRNPARDPNRSYISVTLYCVIVLMTGPGAEPVRTKEIRRKTQACSYEAKR